MSAGEPMQTDLSDGRWNPMYRFLDKAGPFTNVELFEPGQNIKDFVHNDCKILVVGAGGLGCELLKNLALSGFNDIHVIDMDTIDLSNLNRQFLFRQKDIGRPKAIVASEFVMQRVKGVTVTPHFCKIQDKDDEFYKQFSIIITGLDSIEARRWMNATIVNMYDEDDPSTLKPIIDGGFKGQARVIIPHQGPCFECSLNMFTEQTTYPICTIANTPRLPEHCIEWASVLQWPKAFPDTKLDGDNPEHITWLYNTALKRANEFNITGITYSLTQGVVKNIIPAIASTNAVIAAACTNEALKLATQCQPTLDNYMSYNGTKGVYTYTFSLAKEDDCPVCGSEKMKLDVKSDTIVRDFIEMLREIPKLQLKKPSIRTAGKSIYMPAPPPLEEATRPNLDKKLIEFVASGHEFECTITDSNLPLSLTLKINFS
ncbi:hypothetical protein BKA69DRAFT_1153277 [Paraphysoderma sedebokerense]|nr:hypothetical protein BKA69DRAFT_1153277 [Paraphysoderma sedebokerense]